MLCAAKHFTQHSETEGWGGGVADRENRTGGVGGVEFASLLLQYNIPLSVDSDREKVSGLGCLSAYSLSVAVCV